MIDYVDLREVDPGTLVDLLGHLAGNLRQSDLDEINATSELTPMHALVESVRVSERGWIITVDGEPVCIFGAAPSGIPNGGIVWMLGTPRMDERRVALSICRNFRPYLDELHKLWPVLWNRIDARNQKSMDWLTWGGFRLIEAHPNHGREGRLFFTFSRYQPHV